MDRPHELLESAARDRSSRARPYDPPALSPAAAALANRLSGRRAPIALALGGAALAFKPSGLASAGDVPSAAARVDFWFRIDGRPLVLQTPKGFYERVLARIDPELLAAELDREMLPLLLEACVADALARAEATLQSRVELLAVEPGAILDLRGPDVVLDVDIDGEPAGRAWLRAGFQDAERLATALEARPKPTRAYGDLKVELRFRAGAVWLDLGQLRRLKVGDALLAEEDASRWDRMAAVVGERWLFPIEITKEGPTLRAPFRRAGRIDRDEWMMIDDEPPPVGEDELPNPLADAPKREAADGRSAVDFAPEPAADAAFDELPIKLIFELGRSDMPLGQLQEIGPGHVFQLDRPLGEAVEIYAGGRRIGQGEVVRIDDQVGVRIVRLFGHGDG